MSDIYIAKDHNGVILSIVRAESQRLASAYWHGNDIIPHTIGIAPEIPAEHPTGVIPILNTVDAYQVLRWKEVKEPGAYRLVDNSK